MKLYKFRWIIGLLSIVVATSLSSCEEDEKKGPWETTSLDVLITEAETLISTSKEGTEPGSYKPGSIAELQEVVTWARWRIDNSENQDDISDASVKLQRYIDKFKNNTIKLEISIPWVKQTPDTYIEISNDIKTVLEGAFTIEVKCYVIDLSQRGYSNNLFSCEQDGPDSGFGVRYFGDGRIQIVVGDGSWKDTGDQSGSGAMKAGEWMHVALTNTGNEQVLYINGKAVVSQEKKHVLATNFPLVFGNSPRWTHRTVNAMFRDVRVWEGVRTEQQIKDNIENTLTGEETNLKLFLPLQTNLGSEFSDVTGNYTAKFIGDIEWVVDGTPPEIKLIRTSLELAITDAENFKVSIKEGPNDGDFPIGTKAYLDEIIAHGNEVRTNATRQFELDDEAEAITAKIRTIQKMFVADSDGVLIDREIPEAVGLRITPNYTPQGDYTVEFDVNVKSLAGYKHADLFNNGEFGIRLFGYEEESDEKMWESGGLWNYTNAGNGWEGPKTEARIIPSGNWKHVAIIHDDAARTTKIYVDGVEMGVQEDIGAPKESGWGEIWLGNGWDKMNGSIRDFRLWDVVRSEADLDAAITGTENGLRIYFPLDKVSGVKFKDATGNFSGEMRGIKWNTVE